MEWYEEESRKVVVQSRVDDVQQSEKVRIYHHEQHKKNIKRTAIIKLQTEGGILVGHEACSTFLESQLAKLLLNPADLDQESQATLLAEMEPVYTEADNNELEKLPEVEEVKSVLFDSNLSVLLELMGLFCCCTRYIGTYWVSLSTRLSLPYMKVSSLLLVREQV